EAEQQREIEVPFGEVAPEDANRERHHGADEDALGQHARVRLVGRQSTHSGAVRTAIADWRLHRATGADRCTALAAAQARADVGVVRALALVDIRNLCCHAACSTRVSLIAGAARAARGPRRAAGQVAVANARAAGSAGTATRIRGGGRAPAR